MAKVLIVGCGDLGTALGELLLQEGHQVTGLKRNPPEQAGSGIKYFRADISCAAALENLDADFEQVFFIVSPPGRNERDYRAVYEYGVQNLLAHFSRRQCNPPWLFVSSTSVYGQSHGEWVDENSPAQPTSATSKCIAQAEQYVWRANPDNIVLRFSGIYGPGRESLLRMARQAPEIQRDPPYYSNRIHRQDCIGVLAFLFKLRLAGQTLQRCYLASDDDPAPQWDVVSWLAEHMHCPPPIAKTLGAEAEMNKRCSNRRLKSLGYRFRYPSYREGYAPLIDAAAQRGCGS